MRVLLGGEGRRGQRAPSEVLRTGLIFPEGSADAFTTHLPFHGVLPGLLSGLLLSDGPEGPWSRILQTSPSDLGPGQGAASSSVPGLAGCVMSLQTWYPGSLVNPLFTAFPAAVSSPFTPHTPSHQLLSSPSFSN